jgi:hypothetical protein
VADVTRAEARKRATLAVVGRTPSGETKIVTRAHEQFLARVVHVSTQCGAHCSATTHDAIDGHVHDPPKESLHIFVWLGTHVAAAAAPRQRQ